MKIYGAITDGYQFIYSQYKEHIEDWLYIYQENFCLLKVFELDINNDVYILENMDLMINLKFNKNEIKQNEYTEKFRDNAYIYFQSGVAILLNDEDFKLNDLNDISKYKIELTDIEKVIINTSRNHTNKKAEKIWQF